MVSMTLITPLRTGKFMDDIRIERGVECHAGYGEAEARLSEGDEDEWLVEAAAH
jgi:hypothetical protein